MLETVKIKCPAGAVFDAGKKVVAMLSEQGGGRAYWVGGAPRDILLGRPPSDVDIVTSVHPQVVQQLFPDSEMVGACFGVVLVKIDGFVFEVATCREERLYLDGRRPEEVKFTDDFSLDVMRRDFTVNAMLYDPFAEELLDYNGGLQDAARQILRVVGKPEDRFAEDQLRLFRAVRFAAKLGFEIEAEAFSAIRRMAPLTASLAAERVRDELEMMLAGSAPVRALELLKTSGLLNIWLPEVEALEGVEQCEKYHPEGDVWQHTLLMFKNLQGNASVPLAWSILLHDVGKKAAFSCSEDKVPHFYCHETIGADMIKDIAERLRFSNDLAECVEHAVRNHMRFAHVRDMRQAKLKRLLAEKDFLMELELHRLDCMSSNGLMESYEFLKNELQKSANIPPVLPEPLIKGGDLIRLGLQPGPDFKVMLDAVMDAQLEGRVCNKTEALDFLSKTFELKNI